MPALSTILDPTLFATALATLVVIQDPAGAVPIFLSLTSRQTQSERHRSARQATLVSFGVIIVFAVFGRYILQFLGISVPALQLSGGLLLLLVAMELLTGKADENPDTEVAQVNAALVPLGTPLLAGPGAIVAAMVTVESSGSSVSGWVAVGTAIVVSHLIVWLTLRFSTVLIRVLRESGIILLTRISGLLLAAIAVQMMADAVFAFLKSA